MTNKNKFKKININNYDLDKYVKKIEERIKGKQGQN